MLEEKKLTYEIDEESLDVIAGGNIGSGGIITDDGRKEQYDEEFKHFIEEQNIDLKRYQTDMEYQKAVNTQIIKTAGDVISGLAKDGSDMARLLAAL